MEFIKNDKSHAFLINCDFDYSNAYLLPSLFLPYLLICLLEHLFSVNYLVMEKSYNFIVL